MQPAHIAPQAPECAGPVGCRGAAGSLSLGFGEIQTARVHAKSLAGGLGPVGKDMTEVGAARCTRGLGPSHTQTPVFMKRDQIVSDRLPEAGPAGTAFVFGVRGKERCVADDAFVNPLVFVIPRHPGEGPFGPSLLGDVILLGGETLTKLVLGEGLGWFCHAYVTVHQLNVFQEFCSPYSADAAGVLYQVDLIQHLIEAITRLDGGICLRPSLRDARRNW